MTEASDTFLTQFGGVGSPSITCTCGRRHHAVDSNYINANEAEGMKADAASNPERVVLSFACDGISAKCVGDFTIVPDCPCGVMAKLEQLVWAERARILAYYKARRDQDADELKGLDEVAP